MIKEDMKLKMTGSEYIYAMFKDTVDSKLTLTYYPDDGTEEYTQTYDMDWTEENAHAVAQKFETLRSQLDRIGLLHDALKDREHNAKLLTWSELTVWETYLAPFADHDLDDDAVADADTKRFYGDQLTAEEEALLERYDAWIEQQCLQRLPYKGRSPVYLINRARRYERLVSLNAPEIIRDNEARCLAEQLVLYYCAKHEEI